MGEKKPPRVSSGRRASWNADVAFLERSAPAWNVESRPPRGLRTRGSQSRGRLGGERSKGKSGGGGGWLGSAPFFFFPPLLSSPPLFSSFPWFDLPRLRLFHQARILFSHPAWMDLRAPHPPSRLRARAGRHLHSSCLHPGCSRPHDSLPATRSPGLRSSSSSSRRRGSLYLYIYIYRPRGTGRWAAKGGLVKGQRRAKAWGKRVNPRARMPGRAPACLVSCFRGDVSCRSEAFRDGVGGGGGGEPSRFTSPGDEAFRGVF